MLSAIPRWKGLSRYARLLPTKLAEYEKAVGPVSTNHVLIVGNHFAHKASDNTAAILSSSFPTHRFIVMGSENGVANNVRTYKAGTLDEQQMESLYSRASIVILPSYVEGFGFGLLHALAARKVVVARDIAATREILATYKKCRGVFLYSDNNDIVRAFKLAMTTDASEVDDGDAEDWHVWVDGFANFCVALADHDDVFDQTMRRIRAGDLLRKSELSERLLAVAPAEPAAAGSKNGITSSAIDKNGAIADLHGRQWHPARHVNHLLNLEGEAFVYSAYVTIFKRLPDSDGLVNYLSELQSGISKIEILSRLRNSSECRQSGHSLAGYWWAAIGARVRHALDFSGLT